MIIKTCDKCGGRRMSVVIKGLSMPKNCLLCPCCVGEGIGAGRQHYCQAIDDEPQVSENYHPKNCPLIEMPAPHGRLIDVDYIKQIVEWECQRFIDSNNHAVVGMTVERIFDMLKSVPTIIEAEVSE